MSDKDTIYRQDVIDAFWKLDIELKPSAIDAITGMLKELPSAQPEILARGEGELNVPDTNVGDCSDCIKHGGDWDCDYVHCHKGESAQPERKNSEWMMHSDYPDCLICSKCGAQFDVWHWESKQMHFCPNCGAKME